MKWNLKKLTRKNKWFALAAAFVFVATVAATSYNNYSKSANDAVGNMALVYNSVDTTIADGTIVMVDTTTAATSSIDRFAVRTYNPATSPGLLNARVRAFGVAVGPIARSSQGGLGKVLMDGYHPRARFQLSTGTAFTPIKLGTAHGSLTTEADTTGVQVGVLIAVNSGTASNPTRWTAKVLITKRLAGHAAGL